MSGCAAAGKACPMFPTKKAVRRKQRGDTPVISAKGRSYFSRKDVLQKMEALGMFDDLPKEKVELFDEDSLTSMAMRSHKLGLYPMVTFVPLDQIVKSCGALGEEPRGDAE